VKAGLQFVFQLERGAIGVSYNTHFVERYSDKRDRRSAPRDRIDETTVVEKIKAAMPQISDIMDIQTEFEGVIYSRKLHFVMTFDLRATTRGSVLVLTSVMSAVSFVKRSITDYWIEINPPIEVMFRRGLSEPLRMAVLSDIFESVDIMEDGTAYHLGGDGFQYWVERYGDTFNVDDASWKHDLYEIQVA
jgi:hypothetical protein